MRKKPFLTFSAIVGLLVGAAIWFIQSRAFAGIFKQMVYRYLPSDLGVEADFSEFAIKMFPPGISLKDPRIVLRENNILRMPVGSSVKADRIDFDFRLFQMFTGNIRVHEMVIVNGELHLFYNPQGPSRGKTSAKHKPGLDASPVTFHWDELFQFHAEGVSVQNAKVRIDWLGSSNYAELHLRSMSLGQWFGQGGLGYDFAVDLDKFDGSVFKDWSALGSVDSVQGRAHVNAAGVELDSVSLRGQGHEASASGMIRGNLQNPKAGLNLDVNVKVDAELASIVKIIDSRADIEGNAQFTGRVRGNLEKIEETLRFDGKLNAQHVRYRSFYADEIDAAGGWDSAPQGGEILLDHAVITTQDAPRSFRQGARGGKVRVGSCRLILGGRDPMAVHLDLEKAQVQWLAALAMPDVKPISGLTLKASGPMDLKINPARNRKRFEAQAEVKLAVEEFQLDNQRLREIKPLRRVFRIPKLTLEGPASFDAAGFHSGGMRIGIDHTQLTVTGKIDGDSGYDLHGIGPIRLEELGEISENPARGEGNVNVAVHGPAKRVLIDIDADLKNAYYLHMNLGDLSGRITWDDGPDHLIFRQVHLAKGASQYVVDGMLDTGKVESVSLNAAIPKGNIQEFIQIFSEMTQGLWWFPRSVTGPFTGGIKVSGGLDTRTLQVDATVDGAGWEFMGERFDRVTLKGGYDKGKYQVSNFSAVKHGSLWAGHVFYLERERSIDWDFHARGVAFGDFDRVARLDVPIRGKLSLESTGKGKEGAIASETRLQLTDVAVRGVPMPPSALSMSSQGGLLKIHGAALDNEGELELVYDFNPLNTSLLRAELKHFDFSPVLLLLNPKLIPDPGVAGYASGSVDLSFHSGAIERASGEISLSEYLLSKTGARFQLARPRTITVTDGNFEVRDLALIGNRGETTLSLRGRDAELEGRITGDLDLSLLEFFMSAISKAVGTASLDFIVGGALKNPTVIGRTDPQNASLWIQGMDAPFENVTGSLQLQQNVLEIRDLGADLAGGRVTADGRIAFFADHYPEVAIKSRITGSKLKIHPFDFVKLHGDLDIGGDQIPYEVTGGFTIDSALIRQSLFQRRGGEGLKVARYTPPPSSKSPSDYPLFKLKIDVSADRGIQVQNDLFDAELKADITVINTMEAPRVLGEVDMVDGKGTINFKDRAFQIQSASAVFDNPAVIDPKFSLIANTDVSGSKIRLYSAGTMENYKIELSSTPVMTQSEILSLLAIGLTASEEKRLNANDRSTIEQGEAASLLLHSLDFNREVENKTGIQIQLDESTNTLIGTSAFRPQAATETTASPRIVIKKRIANKLDVSYANTVGVGTNSDREVNAEYKATPGISVIGVWDDYQTIDTQDRRTSFGADLKFQKRFK